MTLELIWAMLSNDAVGDDHDRADSLTTELPDERVFANLFIS